MEHEEGDELRRRQAKVAASAMTTPEATYVLFVEGRGDV